MVLAGEEANTEEDEAGLSDVSSVPAAEIEENKARYTRPESNINRRWLGRAEMKKRYELRQEALRKQLEKIRRDEEERLEREREDANAPPVERDDVESDAGSGFSDVSGGQAGKPRLLDGPDLDVEAVDSDDEKVAEVATPAAPERRDSLISLGASDEEEEVIPKPEDAVMTTVISHNDDSNRVLLQVQAMKAGEESESAPPRPVVVRLRHDWAPTGAARFMELVEAGFYDGTRFHRVVNGSLAQFGLPVEPDLYSQWKSRLLQDDKEVKAVGNSRGSLSFAESGEHARCCQVFLNLGHNNNLNRQGFIPFAEVVQGMDVMDELCDGYGDIPPKGQGPDPEIIKEEGLSYLDRKFPMLSWILEAKVLSRSGDTDIRRPSLKKPHPESESGSPQLEEKKKKSVVYFSNDSPDPKDPSSPAGAGFKAAKLLKKNSI